MSLASLYDRKRYLIRGFIAFALIFALMSSVTSPVFAAGGQFGALQGIVVDQATKTPVSGVTVKATSASGTYTGRTDSRGFFSILGVPVDTYSVAFAASGFEPYSLSGVSVQGDQTQNLGTVSISKSLSTIARVQARSQAGAFQPNQTTDQYTINSSRILQTQGKSADPNENEILLAAPGVTLVNSGNPTIRGGAASEVGYQLDGVTFTEPFLNGNGSNGLVNGVGTVQVVEGAGDPTQGGVGSGVINLIPKRGTNPGFGYVDFEAGGPNFNHQFAAEYGIATANGAFSNYIAYTGQRYNPYQGYFNATAAPQGTYFGASYQNQNQWTDNFVFKFGRDQKESFSALWYNQNAITLGNYGGISGLYSETNPNGLAYYPYDPIYTAPLLFYSQLSQQQFQSLVGLTPGTPATNQTPPSAQVNNVFNTNFFKLEYDNNQLANTFIALRYYNWQSENISDGSFSNGQAQPTFGFLWDNVGGNTTGQSIDITHQFNSKFTAALNFKYDVLHPIWDGYGPADTALSLSPLIFGSSYANTADWLPGGYVYDYFNGNVPRIPEGGIGFNKTFFQNYGTGINFTLQPTAPFKLAFGVRYEGQNQHWFNQLDQWGLGIPAGTPGGPYGVAPSEWTSRTLNPTAWEPRANASYQITPQDGVRASYGRSAVFANAQTAGTPWNMPGLAPYVNIPSKPGAVCALANGNNAPCTSYAQQIYWQSDSFFDAPDAGNSTDAVYSNYDFTYQHQFKNGIGARVTGFYKLGTGVPLGEIIQLFQGGGGVFEVQNTGTNRTTGVEFNLTTPDKVVGTSGFFSATYQNVLSTTIPLSVNETNVPLLPPATVALGQLYRAGYVSPFSFRTGATYKSKGGFSATPVLQFNIGYPYSPGNTVANTCGTNAAGNPNYQIVRQVNFGCGIPYTNSGVFGTGGTGSNTAYYDPADPGTNYNPNIAATRGNNQTSSYGGYLSHPNLEAYLTLAYKFSANTLGIKFNNLFGNAFINSVPAANPYYQPVATGVSGPQTGYNPGCPYGPIRGCANIPSSSYAYNNGSFILGNGNFTNGASIAPLVPFNFTVFFQRSL